MSSPALPLKVELVAVGDLIPFDKKDETRLRKLSKACRFVVLTGGEPALQWDRELADLLNVAGYKCAMETTGEFLLAAPVQWITISAKPRSRLKGVYCDELRVVVGDGEVPDVRGMVAASWKCVSPRFDGQDIDAKSLAWCIEWVKAHPDWRLSVQQHKGWKIR